MRRVAFTILSLSVLGATPPKPAPADLVLRNGAVYTVDAARSWAQAVAVSAGRIVWVGTDGDAARWIGGKTHVVDSGVDLERFSPQPAPDAPLSFVCIGSLTPCRCTTLGACSSRSRTYVRAPSAMRSSATLCGGRIWLGGADPGSRRYASAEWIAMRAYLKGLTP